MIPLPEGWSRPVLALTVVALLALAFGVWDAAVGISGEGWILRLVLPLLLVVFIAALYSRARRERLRADEARRESDAAPDSEPREPS